LTLSLLIVSLVACSPTSPTTQLPNYPTTQTPTLTETPTPTLALPAPVPQAQVSTAEGPTIPRTPPALPAGFTTSLLNPLDTPHTYITDTCQYLKARWDPNNAAPGAVVMVIMFHSILKAGDELTDYNQISSGAFDILMRDLHEQNFQAINTQQLADFLEHNAKIPPRSVMLLVDDRRFNEYFNKNFRPYWESYGWPVVNAWISTPYNTADLWQQQVDLEAEGWVDHQAHGVVHNTPISEYSPDSYILGELQGSITAFQEHFNKTPIAFIWPLGRFTPHAVQLARQSGYRLGFTINPRGPLMFNWIPLSDNPDPRRPSYMPEGPVGDPLMVLPRFWSFDADKHIDYVRVIGQEAADYAEVNRAVELEYYDIVCAPVYGPIPTP
jgi:hypothetical protein